MQMRRFLLINASKAYITVKKLAKKAKNLGLVLSEESFVTFLPEWIASHKDVKVSTKIKNNQILSIRMSKGQHGTTHNGHM